MPSTSTVSNSTNNNYLLSTGHQNDILAEIQQDIAVTPTTTANTAQPTSVIHSKPIGKQKKRRLLGSDDEKQDSGVIRNKPDKRRRHSIEASDDEAHLHRHAAAQSPAVDDTVIDADVIADHLIDERRHSTDSSSSALSNQYEVDFIVKHKTERGRQVYLVRWLGYTPADDTWEPAKHVKDTYALYEYNEKQKTIARQRKAERQSDIDASSGADTDDDKKSGPTLQSERLRDVFDGVKEGAHKLSDGSTINIDYTFILNVNIAICDMIRRNDDRMIVELAFTAEDERWTKLKAAIFNAATGITARSTNKLDVIRAWVQQRFQFLAGLQYPTLCEVQPAADAEPISPVASTRLGINQRTVSSVSNLTSPSKRDFLSLSVPAVKQHEHSRVGRRYQAAVTDYVHRQLSPERPVAGDKYNIDYYPPTMPVLQPGESHPIRLYHGLEEDDFQHVLEYGRLRRADACEHHAAAGERCANNCPFREQQIDSIVASPIGSDLESDGEYAGPRANRQKRRGVKHSAPADRHASTSARCSSRVRAAVPDDIKRCRFCNVHAFARQCLHKACITCCRDMGMGCKVDQHVSGQRTYEVIVIDGSDDDMTVDTTDVDLRDMWTRQLAHSFARMKTIVMSGNLANAATALQQNSTAQTSPSSGQQVMQQTVSSHRISASSPDIIEVV